MGKKIISAQRPFTMLIANIRGGSDPSLGETGNPVILRQTMTQQYFVEIPNRGPDTMVQGGGIKGLHNSAGALLTGASSASSGTITVDSITFSGPTSIRLGQYVLVTDQQFAVGLTAAATATNLAAAIDALPEYSATAVGDDVNITGPTGPSGATTIFRAEGADPYHFTLSPDHGNLSGGSPSIGPVTFTT